MHETHPTGAGDIVDLHSGDDLDSALARSRPDRGESRSRPGRPDRMDRPGQVAWTVRTVLRHALKAARRASLGRCRELVVTGAVRDSDRRARVRYVGTMENFHFLMRAAFTEYDVSDDRKPSAPAGVLAAIRRAVPEGTEDCLFVDCESPVATLAARAPFLRVPPWVRQRLDLPGGWTDVLARLPRRTRRGVARCLRKYGFRGRVNRTPGAVKNFYENLYRGYILRRHGAEAVVVSEERFRAEFAGGAIVELIHEGAVIGANAVRVSGGMAGPGEGRKLSIVWCGFSEQVGARDLKGASEALDYFSVLQAMRAGCTTMDFGASRPRLDDGTLQYKAKWGTRLQIGRLPTAPILVAPRHLGPAATALLANLPWVTRSGRVLSGHVLLEGGPVPAVGAVELARRFLLPGMETLRVHSCGGFEPGTEDAVREAYPAKKRGGKPPVRLVDLKAEADPLGAYLRG